MRQTNAAFAWDGMPHCWFSHRLRSFLSTRRRVWYETWSMPSTSTSWSPKRRSSSAPVLRASYYRPRRWVVPIAHRPASAGTRDAEADG